MKKNLHLAFSLSFSIVLLGCATLSPNSNPYEIKINSLAVSNGPEYRTFDFMPGMEGTSWEDLQFQEYVTYLHHALESKGYKFSRYTKDAEIMIAVSYGVQPIRPGRYYRYLNVRALDYATWQETKVLTPLWEVTAESSGRSGDLRKVFPKLVAASLPFLGVDSGETVHVELQEDDPVVQMVEGWRQE